MRTEKEIIERLNNYDTNADLRGISPQAQALIKTAIIELSWCLGEEPNIRKVIKKEGYR
jgi:hypothetical protein